MQRKEIIASLEGLAEAFKRASNNLFSVTRPEQLVEYEKALYLAMYLKPSKRLAKIFSSDREILALFTNFSDLQQRTVALAKTHIESADGRLENTLAIVVHGDPEGNLRLKRWGREVGISVLPIYASRGILDGASLERDLLQDFFANDPFDVTGPVCDDARFFGRRSESVDIARQLQSGQIKSCLGIRKIGKTSVLSRVLHEVESSHDCLSIVIDCSRDDVWSLSASDLLHAIELSIRTGAAAAERKVELLPGVSCPQQPADVATLVATIKQVGKPVILFFDEVDYITPGSPTSLVAWTAEFNYFWRSLRAVYQQCMRDRMVLSLFISGVSSKWFKIESIAGVENAALAFIPDDYLSPLAPAASGGMVRAIARVCGITLDDETAEQVGAMCGHMPYWTRKAGSYLHHHVDVASRPIVVSREIALRHVHEFIQVEGAAIAEVALAHLFRVYPELYPDCVRILNGEVVAKAAKTVSTLLRYGILSVERGSVRIGSPLIAAGLRLHMEQSASGANAAHPLGLVPNPEKLKFSIGEWADELALINASRNKIERRLRSVVLNFLAFSSLTDPTKDSAAERLLKCVQSQRKGKMQVLPADELIEKLLWTELCAVVSREWSLFSVIFIDKAHFSQHSLVINERYDAHAKEADAADLALYRKSLRWFEDRVKKAAG